MTKINFKCSAAIIVAIIMVFTQYQSAMAQQTVTAKNCYDAQVMQNFNGTQFAGKWYEVARNPAASNNISCIEVDISMANSTHMTINTTYSNTPSALYKNQTVEANITLINDISNSTGYNVIYTMPGMTMSTMNTTYKILNTDYSNYALICGFTNVSDNSTYFGLVLTRQRTPTNTSLMTVEHQAQANYSDFGAVNFTMPLITQSDSCYMNSAATLVPAFGVLILTIYNLLKFIA